MKRFSRLGMIITLISISLLGCGNKTDQAEKNQQPVNQQADNQEGETFEQNQSANDLNKEINKTIEMSNYFISDQKAEITSTEGEITWKSSEITLIAKESSATISSIQINNGTNKYDISIPEEITGNEAELNSVSLSPSKRFIAINIFIKNVGNQLIVIDLADGKNITLNKLDNKYYEEIHSYNWSPTDNKLAFSYGNTSSSKLAIYDFDNQELQTLPDKGLINTLYIIWNKDGKGLDFISESPTDEFKLYRYDPSKNTIEEKSSVPLDELSKYSEFVPDIF